MRNFLRNAGIVACLLAPSALAFGTEEINTDKQSYSLLKPTPFNLLREFSTDRPDKTESAYTVDAGHYQIEADLVNYSYDRHNSSRNNTHVDSFSFATMNLKVGILNNLDVQLVVPTWNHVRTEDRTTGIVQKNSGFGDLTLRAKYNLWGNDGGSTAFAVMPFVKAPTAQDDLGNEAFEGGIIFPFAVSLPKDWGMGLMTAMEWTKDRIGTGRHAEFINSITFSHGLISKLDGYVEFFSAVSAESGSDWVGTVDCGLVYALTEQINLDGGINIGITRSADDLNPFLGMSLRF